MALDWADFFRSLIVLSAANLSIIGCAFAQVDGRALSQSKTALTPDLTIRLKVTGEMVETLELPLGGVVEIQSVGGSESAFLALANRLYELDAKVLLSSICASACAEFFMAYPGRLKLTTNAFVAFHHNSVLLDHLSQADLPAEQANCFSDAASKLRRYRDVRLPDNHIMENQLESMGRYNISVSDAGACSLAIQYEHAWWVPTSSELKSLFKIDAPASICNDDESCSMGMLKLLGASGDPVLLGDRTVIVP